MNDPAMDAHQRRETLSALMDGQAHDTETAQACAAWRDSDDAQERWATYHLIGDVLRSGDAAGRPGSQAFLAGVRSKLAQEPVVLAPAAVPRTAGASSPMRPAAAVSSQAQAPAGVPVRTRRWAGPMAVAAGFVAVLSGALALQDARWEPGASTLAAARAPAAVLSASGLMLGAAPASANAWAPYGVSSGHGNAQQTFAGVRHAATSQPEAMPVGLVVPAAHPAEASFSERGAPVSELVWRMR